ncbi:MAG: hypothetical protein J1F65_00050 [Clostridiales bacterium]|nr:hypothetical protein [Clostridiales bacterium]
MIVYQKRFIEMVKSTGLTLLDVANVIKSSKRRLMRKLKSKDRFNYFESKRIIDLFGADKMVSVINWKAINVRCPF